MKIGLSAFAWTAHFTEAHLPLVAKVAEYGFDAFEFAMFDPSSLPARSLRRAFEAARIEPTVCAILPPGINPISPDAATRKRSVEHLSVCIETAAEIGAHLVGGPLYAPIGYLPAHRPQPDEWAWAIEAFQSLTPLLEQHSIALGIEPVNRSETFFLRTAQQARTLCEQIDHASIGVTLDTFHANIEEKNIPSAIDHLGPSLKHVHLSENDRSLLGAGHIDFPAILAALHRNQYTGMLMIEGFGFSPTETDAPGTLWADSSVSPEHLAVNGLAYVRQLLREPASASCVPPHPAVPSNLV